MSNRIPVEWLQMQKRLYIPDSYLHIVCQELPQAWLKSTPTLHSYASLKPADPPRTGLYCPQLLCHFLAYNVNQIVQLVHKYVDYLYLMCCKRLPGKLVWWLFLVDAHKFIILINFLLIWEVYVLEKKIHDQELEASCFHIHAYVGKWNKRGCCIDYKFESM